jgi:DNA-binding SARP family transcriptional activator
MRFSVLGPLEAFDGERALAVGAGRQRALLALLLVHAGEIVSRDRLIDELWRGAPPRSASQSLDAYVSRLRRALRAHDGEVVLITRTPGYVLQADVTDARQFADLVDAGREALAAEEPERAATLLREGLAL